MNKPPPRKLVYITWLDAVGDSSREQESSLKDIELATNVNLGWVSHEDAKRIVLAHGWSTTGEVDYVAIPKNCVVSQEYVIKEEGAGNGQDEDAHGSQEKRETATVHAKGASPKHRKAKRAGRGDR